MNKMDEMEMSITLKAIKWAWGYLWLHSDRNIGIRIYSFSIAKRCS